MSKDLPSSGKTTTSSVEVVHALLRLRQLRVVHSPMPPKRAVVILENGTPCSIGREADQPLPLALNDREVSRLHVVIEHDAETDTWSVIDQGSRNGTLVNGVRVDRATLTDGAVIRIGKSLLLYQDVQLQPNEPLRGESQKLLGPSIALQRVRAEIGLVAPRPVPVLILGESGSGKELVAEEIHRQSNRKGPLVPVNCASIPAELAESELFGHHAGAFTGANKRSEGLFVTAQGGTLFLDEIGELPLAIQAKLLRALAKGEIRAVGATDTQTVDVRVVAATHRDLNQFVEDGKFRGDLFARLSGWILRVPALRERREDILPLANAFLGRSGAIKLSTDAAEALLLHGWPFNVRELEQVLSAASVRAGSTGVVKCEHLPNEIAAPIRARGSKEVMGGKSEPPIEVLVARDVVPTKEDLCKVLERFAGNVALVADYFGKDRHQIYRWAKRYDVDLDAFR